MGFFKDLTQYLPSIGAKSTPIALTDFSIWEKWGLTRPNTRIRYDSNSAFVAYRSHELVFACINKIADVMNDAEIVVEFKNAKGEWQKKEGHLLPALFKRPNEYQTGRDVRKLMVQSEMGLGKFYAHIERSNAGIPVAMTVLNPNRVVPKYARNRTEISYYEYTTINGNRIPIKPEDLFIRRRPDLLDQFNGYAPLMAALKSINSDLGLTDYVDAFFESDGTPSGILKILNANVSETKAKAMQADWKQRYGRNGSNQKGVAVLDQNAEFQKIGSNLDELASDALSGRFESRICAVFGVPPNLVGAYVGLLHVTANATAKAELRNFWDNKISGELAVLREWLTWFVLPEFEDIEKIKADQVRVGWDIDQVAFLKEDLEKIHLRARDNFKAGGVTLNEFREAIGLAPDPKGDYYLQPINLMALSPENRALEATQKVEAGKPDDPAKPAVEPPDEEADPKKALTDAENVTGLLEQGVRAIDVKKCQRCGEDHNQLKFLPIFNPTDDYTHYGFCPVKNEPIALAIREKQEKKTFDLDGLTLGREPVGVEAVIDLKKIVADYESEREKCIKILQKFRLNLIEKATEKLDSLTTETAHTLTLTPDPKLRKEIAKTLRSAYVAGKEQILAEIRVQDTKKTKKAFYSKADSDDYLDYLDELTDGLVSRIINEIMARAINEYLTLKLLVDYTVDKLREALLGQSEKFIDQIAGSNVNAAISKGRDAEIIAQADSIDHTQYSAILDRNTCSPCEDADGETADDPLDLPAAPNPDCEGGALCRCIHIAVIV